MYTNKGGVIDIYIYLIDTVLYTYIVFIKKKKKIYIIEHDILKNNN